MPHASESDAHKALKNGSSREPKIKCAATRTPEDRFKAWPTSLRVGKAVRLAVDAREFASDTRGIGRYERAILPRLAKRDGWHITLVLPTPVPAAGRNEFAAILDTHDFTIARTPAGCSALWHPANGTFIASHIPNVATIHGAASFRFPDKNLRKRRHQQDPILRSVEAAKRIIAVSGFNRDELTDVFGVHPERIDVIYHGVDAFFRPEPRQAEQLPEQLRNPYFLFVGDPLTEAAKNFDVLLQGYRSAFGDGASISLAVIGSKDPKIPGVVYAGHASGDVQRRGDELLRSVYCGALAVCIPSYYETFGMPMVEAMACGAPVIASRATCLPEIAGDAALYAPPHDAGAWTEALLRVAGDSALRGDLRDRGFTQAQKYSWDESARRHAEIFERL